MAVPSSSFRYWFQEYTPQQLQDSSSSVPPVSGKQYGSCTLPGVTAAASTATSTTTTTTTTSVFFTSEGGTWIATTTLPSSRQPLAATSPPKTTWTLATAISGGSDDDTLPAPRINPLMVGLSPTKFMLIGGVSGANPVNDAFVGTIDVATSRVVWDRVVNAAGAPFVYTSSEDVPNSLTSTFMLTNNKHLVIVTPQPLLTSQQPQSRLRRSRILVVTRVFFSSTGGTTSATYGHIMGPDGGGAWPCTASERVQMAPLAPGFAIGITTPLLSGGGVSGGPKTWVLWLRTATASAKWSPSDPVDNKATLIQWFNVTTTPALNAPSLRSGMTLFSTASRLNPASSAAVVAVLGASRLWGASLSSDILHVAIFKMITATSFALVWQPVYRRTFDSDLPANPMIGDISSVAEIAPGGSSGSGTTEEIFFLFFGGGSGNGSMITQISVPRAALKNPTVLLTSQ